MTLMLSLEVCLRLYRANKREQDPELDNLTIGGLVAGGGIESTSHKYGLFHHTATEFQVVNGNGDLIVCNEQENADYFHAVPMRFV